MSLGDFGILIGIFTPIAGGIYFLVLEYKKNRLKNWKKFQGAWTNEGDVYAEENTYSHYLEMELNIDLEDGDISGVFKARNLRIDESTTLLSAMGKVKYKKAKIRLMHTGKSLVKIGVVELKIKGKCLLFTLLEGDSNLLPKKTIIWSSNKNWKEDIANW